MGSKLLFRFRSGTHGLNEELGRHNSRNNSSITHVIVNFTFISLQTEDLPFSSEEVIAALVQHVKGKFLLFPMSYKGNQTYHQLSCVLSQMC